jgi:hypothetical protein
VNKTKSTVPIVLDSLPGHVICNAAGKVPGTIDRTRNVYVYRGFAASFVLMDGVMYMVCLFFWRLLFQIVFSPLRLIDSVYTKVEVSYLSNYKFYKVAFRIQKYSTC